MALAISALRNGPALGNLDLIMSGNAPNFPLTDDFRRELAAFTLVELLVVIAIIALLVGLLLPALAKARYAAKEALCLSNHRQLGVAWATYTNDYGAFPYAPSSTGSAPSAMLPGIWAGVDWFPTPAPSNIPIRDRPANPYVGSDVHIDSRMDVFRCPLDNGSREFGTGANPYSGWSAVTLSGEPNTYFGVAGISYDANQWLYCKPGSLNGWGGFPTFTKLRTNQGPHNVVITPDHCVVLQDDGPANWIVSTPSQMTPNTTGSWWHGTNKTVLSFLDGSARIEKAGLVVCDRYSMHITYVDVPYTGWRWPDRP